MTHDDAGDPLLGLLARLPMDAPSAASIDRVRARAHAVLDMRQQPRISPQRGRFDAGVVDGALFVACFTYLAAAVAVALRLGRLIP
jgi:hypothetical protein